MCRTVIFVKFSNSDSGPNQQYDIIGDVHGQAGELETLLEKLGWTYTNPVWHHKYKKAVFVGDLIDRGPEQRRVLQIVRNMHREGLAEVVAGNHEYNAVCYTTKNPKIEGEYLRERKGPKGEVHAKQHFRFLQEFPEGGREHTETIEWFKTLPLWFETEGLRVVHACWDQDSIDFLRHNVTPMRDQDWLIRSSDKTSIEHSAVENLLKGPEIKLPENLWYLDKDGHERKQARYAWWNNKAGSLREVISVPSGTKTINGSDFRPSDEDYEIPVKQYDNSKIVVVGHYWRTGRPGVLSQKIVCVDYSAGNGGPLMAYRYQGEEGTSNDNFTSSRA
jgi:hypothetical protein